MGYAVKEIFLTLQGEGAQTGRVSVFCRFTGCNLWSGREADRATAICSFCDTDFIGTDGHGGGHFADAATLAERLMHVWGERVGSPYVVFTGGEPTLQMDQSLVEACHDVGFEVAIETNGTRAVPDAVDWVTVSPKAGAGLVQTSGDELKVVFPQDALDLDALYALDFEHYFLQPMDGAMAAVNLRDTTARCIRDPRWRLSLQTHKLIGIS